MRSYLPIAFALILLVLIPAAFAADLYVDNLLTGDCIQTYSIADRNCSGTDGNAFVVPQDAADAVVAGDTVLFRRGTYALDGVPPIQITSNSGTADAKITLRNYGAEEVIIDAANVNSIWNGFHGIYVQYSDYIVLQGLTVRNSPEEGIQFYGSDYAEVLNCTVHSNVGPGIYFYEASDYGLVSDCEVYGNGGMGITMLESDYAEVSNNLVYNQNVSNPEASDGIAFGNSDYGLIKGNIVFNNWDDGIDSCCGSMYSTIEDNRVFNSGNDPSGEGDGNGIKVSTANFVGGGGGHVVVRNVVFDNQWTGFDQDKAIGYPQNFFYNNTAYNNRNGFFMDAPALPQDEDAILYNNIASGNSYRDLRRSNDLAVNYSNFNLWGDGLFVPGMDENSLSGDPGFNNPSLVVDTTFEAGWTIEQKMEHLRGQIRDKFSLGQGSQAIDNGFLIAGYHCATAGPDPLGNCREWSGLAPDIGPIEFSGSSCVDTTALLSHISNWEQGSITMPYLISRIAAWKAGTGCP